MAARLSPQVIALLRDLGIPHEGEPHPVPREVAPGGSWPVHAPDAPVAVVLQVTDVDPAALDGAGLFLIEGTEPILTGVVLPRQIPVVAELNGVNSIDLPVTRRLHLHESVPATHADHVRAGALGL